ncbi:winged helix-turn-helix domain-containing protein [Pseudoalteromonas arabiensis]|uniref:winged helix-turn-helix domain-containing protein n=1 Tax=Pseudoalteromonas arabiensis TaxID=874454 RepID=UPI000AC83034|nr:winged helix-turn-helix domain-containing protein [Pseudoalteromonas arabiensis]
MIQVGEYIVDSEQARLLEKNTMKEVTIEPKLFELLLFFIQQPNIIITRQDILDHLWTGSIVTDNAINKLIGNLRKILDDDAKSPRYIQTVPKRGYRFICEVVSISAQDECVSEALNNTQINTGTTKLFYKSFPIIFFTVLASLAGYVLWQLIPSEPKYVSHGDSVALTREHGIEFSAKITPDNQYLLFLKENELSKNNELWLKNINTANLERVKLKNNISKLVAVFNQQGSTNTDIIFLDKTYRHCAVFQAEIIYLQDGGLATKKEKRLFDCKNKRIKDIDYHTQQHAIYYTAQPKNFWPNHIYVFDLKARKHSLLPQVEPEGWGHHGIDISPDGKKLLIMSTKSDYKTQLLSLNLSNNQVTEGMQFDRPVYEAIWHHDSENVYYFSSPPTHQIIKSDLYGANPSTVVNVSEELSSQMSRMPDGKNIVFGTRQKSFSNRWLVSSKGLNTENIDFLSNSTVNDTTPALFHRSEQYLFTSNRNGRMQLFLGDYQSKKVNVLTNFDQPYSIGHLAISPDDKQVIVNIDNKVYLLSIDELNKGQPIKSLQQMQLIYIGKGPIIALDWYKNAYVAVTAVSSGIPELHFIDLFNEASPIENTSWSYALSDAEQPNNIYLIEHNSHLVYKMKVANETAIFNTKQLISTEISLPEEFYSVKVDDGVLYYLKSENNQEYLNAVPLTDTKLRSKWLVKGFSSYDVSRGKIIVSDIKQQEGDIHRTMN